MARALFIDVYRGLAVLLVTGFHLWRALDKPTLRAPGSLRSFDALGALANGSLGVDLFFFISGFCVVLAASARNARTPGAYGHYVLARWLRVAPAYYVAIVVWNVIIAWAGVAVKPHSFHDNLTHLLFVHNWSAATFFSVSGVFWSLGVELQFYLLLPLLLPWLRARPLRLLALVGLLSLAINLTCASVVYTWSVLAFLPLFVAGAGCALHFEGVRRVLGRPGVMALTLLSAGIVLSYRGKLAALGEFKRVVAGLVLGLCMVATSELIARHPSRVWRGLAFLGRASYSIYLYNYLYQALPLPHGPMGWVWGFVVVLGGGTLMHFAVEAPCMRWRKRVLERLPVAPRVAEENRASVPLPP